MSLTKNSLNQRGSTLFNLELKDYHKRLEVSFGKKAKQVANYNHLSIVAITQWGVGWWFNKKNDKIINQINIGSISPKISGV